MVQASLTVEALAKAYQFKFIPEAIQVILDDNGLTRRREIQLRLPNGRYVQLEAYIKESGDSLCHIGSASDPFDDNSTEYDYLDVLGNSFDGCFMQLIRQLSEHY